MKPVSWHAPQVFIVETGWPLSSTFAPAASSRAKSGCRLFERLRPPAARRRRQQRRLRPARRGRVGAAGCVHGSFLPPHSIGSPGIAEGLPVHAAGLAGGGMAVVALQGLVGGLDHVRGRPVHRGFGEAVLAAVGQAGDRLGQPEGLVPVEGRPVAVLAGRDGLQQVAVDGVVGLLGDVHLEREDARLRVVDRSGRLVDVGRAVVGDRVAEQVAVVVVAVEPEVGRARSSTRS